MNQSSTDRDLSVGSVISSGGSERRIATAQNSMLAIIGAITSQVVFITALLYYFGWVYADSFFGYFGVDFSLVGYSTIDYVLRSINATFKPFVYLIFVAFVLFNFHRLMVVPALMRVVRGSSPLTVDSGVSGKPVTPHYVRPISRAAVSVAGWVRVLFRWWLGLSGVRRIIRALQVVAIVLAVIVFAGELFLEQVGVRLGFLLPGFLVLAVGLLGYIEYLRLRYAEAFVAAKNPWSTPPSRSYFLALLMVGVVVVLWVVSHYAEGVGTQRAAEIADHLLTRPRITVYSTQRLMLNGHGVVVEEIAEPDSKYHYQYIGLRLLVRSGDKFLLLPSQWQRGRDRVLFLRDDDSVRINVATD